MASFTYMEEIHDYAVIGNGRSAALISLQGSLDWLCWPRFDSPSLFAKILDPTIGGYWKIAPSKNFKAERCYIPNTNVLETKFATDTGKIKLTDFMTALSEEEKGLEIYPEHEIVRNVFCEEGDVEIEILFSPAPNYARDKTVIHDKKCLGLRIELGQELFSLHSNIKFNTIQDGVAQATIRMKSGESLNFILTYNVEGPAVIPFVDDQKILARLDGTIRWWKEWTDQIKYEGPYKKNVIRSALALKLMNYAPSGAFVAAPTTSLPERIGGDINWDYRFCWLRDASFTVRSLLELGFRDEAEAFTSWMLHSTRLTLPELKVIYDVYGNKMGDEISLHHLSGYAHSRPVRIGNATRDQMQLDVYGEVVDGVFYFVEHGGELDSDMKKMLRHIGRYVCKNWQKKDSGIWEERSDLEHYTYSKLMCWVALDRLLSMKQKIGLSKSDKEMFELHRSSIRKEIEQKGWNSNMNSFTSTLQGDKLDACMLLIPFYGFDDANTAKMQQTYKKIDQILNAGAGLIYRYEKSFNQEGAFLICSFWKIDYLLRAGRKQEARQYFEELLGYANDLGLFAEEVDPKTGKLLGNFPQAFTHLGIINTALALEKDYELA